MALHHQLNDKASFRGEAHRPRLSSHPATEHSRSSQDYDPFLDHTGAEGVLPCPPKAPTPHKTCCTCSGLGMVEVNNGVGGYFTMYCDECEAGIELEAQDAMAEALWDRQMAGGFSVDIQSASQCEASALALSQTGDVR